MTIQNVNTVKLQQAIKKYGSLQAAIEDLEKEKKTLENEISLLENKLKSIKKNEARIIDNIKRLERTLDERKQELHELEDWLEKFKQDVEEYVNNNKQFMLQYLMVEEFVAMLRTSPSEKESVQELAGLMILLSDTFWKFSQEPYKLRKFFVHTVLGSYLYCYRCDRCGLKFIANQEVKSHILGYHCPNCGSLSSMRPDNSFLDTMLNAN